MNVKELTATIAPVVLEKLRSSGRKGVGMNSVVNWISDEAGYKYRGVALNVLVGQVLAHIKNDVMVWETHNRRMISLKAAK